MPIEDDDDKPAINGAQEASQSLREEIAGNLTDQGVKVPKEAIEGGSPSAANEAPTVEKVEKVAPPAPEADPTAPVSFSKPAKAAVEKLQAGLALNPEEGRVLAAALSKREAEINVGLSRLKDYKGLEEYASTYSQQGLSVKQVLDGYHEAERRLQTDFVGGLGMLCERFGVNPQALVTHLAQRMGLAPNNGAQPVPQPGMTQQERQAVMQLAQNNQRLEQELAGLKQQVHVNGVRDVASRARTAGSSITGGPSATPPSSVPNQSVREMLEQAFASGGRT